MYLAPTPPNTRLNAITQALGVHMADASGRNYGFGPDLPGSPGIGTTADHFTFTYEIPGWTLELEPANGGQDYGGLASHGHSGFILPDAQAARMRDDVARQYLLGFYRQSGPPAAVAAEIRELPGNAVVYRARWERERRRRAHARSRGERGAGAGRQLPALGRLQQADAHPQLARATSCPTQARVPGADVGTVTLEVPSLDGADVALGGGAWLGLPGGAPDGYLRYADDAFAVDFTLPDTIERRCRDARRAVPGSAGPGRDGARRRPGDAPWTGAADTGSATRIHRAWPAIPAAGTVRSSRSSRPTPGRRRPADASRMRVRPSRRHPRRPRLRRLAAAAVTAPVSC